MRKWTIERVTVAVLALGAMLASGCDSESTRTSPSAVCPPGYIPVCPDVAAGTGACTCEPLAPVGGGAAGAAGVAGQAGASGGGGAGAGGSGALAGAGAGAGAGGSAGDAGMGGRGRGIGRGQAGMGGTGGASGRGMPAAGSGGSPPTSSDEGSDGCSDTLVSGLSLAEVSVFQSVKIPVMKNMAAVERRNADVVQSRDALFRIHVTPQMGWTPRQVSARVELMAGMTSRRFHTQLMPARASTDDDPATAFRVRVPAEAMTADARFAVSLVECGAPAAAAAAPSGARFPADGFAELRARQTGRLRIHLLPLGAQGRMPEITQAAMDVFKKRLQAMYPVTSVDFTVGEPLQSTATSMCSHLTAIRSRRTADRAPIDMYYYGVTIGTSGGQSGCSTATPNANSSSKTSAGWLSAGNRQGSLEGGASTMTHELGHAHGRLHAPCQVQDPDRNYPYQNADIGVWAYDVRSDQFLPPNRKDMMSYCPNPDRSGAWLSDYTYQALVERIAAVNRLVDQRPQALVLSTEPATSWRQLVSDSTGIQWSEHRLLTHELPPGVAMDAIVRDERGASHTVQVYREDLEDGVSHGAFLLAVPEPKAGWRSLEVPGLLAPRTFE